VIGTTDRADRSGYAITVRMKMASGREEQCNDQVCQDYDGSLFRAGREFRRIFEERNSALICIIF
jgi:hypothetical protein